MLKTTSLAALVLALATGAASAHVTLETREAVAGSSYKAILRVPHGCGGSATLKFTVQIPEGYFSVKPMPHAGWTLSTVVGPYAKTYVNHGTEVTQGVTEVSWSGGNLPDAYYDEFVLSGTLAGDLPAGMIYFPAVQECEQGFNRWIEIPVEGQPSPAEPAPGLKIVPKP